MVVIWSFSNGKNRIETNVKIEYFYVWKYHFSNAFKSRVRKCVYFPYECPFACLCSYL